MYAPLPSQEEKPRQRRTAPLTLWALSLLTVGLIVAISTALHHTPTLNTQVLTSVSGKWGLPEQVFYFQKSSVRQLLFMAMSLMMIEQTLLMLEKGSKVLRRSQDQGKSWAIVQGLNWDGYRPDSLVLHPYAQEDTVSITRFFLECLSRPKKIKGLSNGIWEHSLQDPG